MIQKLFFLITLNYLKILFFKFLNYLLVNEMNSFLRASDEYYTRF
jgi:hypothetical protein